MTEVDARFREQIRALVRETNVLTLGSLVAMGCAILTLVILTQSLSAVELGGLIVINTFPLLMHQFFNLQSWQGFVRAAPQELVSEEDIKTTAELLKFFLLVDVASAIGATLIALSLSGVLIQLFGWDSDWYGYLQLFACSLLVNLTSFSLISFRRFKAYNRQAFCIALLPATQLIAAIILATMDVPLQTYVYTWWSLAVLTYLVFMVLALKTLSEHDLLGWLGAKTRFFKAPIAFTFWMNSATSLDAVVKQFDVLLVSTLVSLEAVPIYRFIKQAGAIMYRLADSLAQTSFPRMVGYLSRGDLSSALALFKRSLVWIAPLALLYVVVVASSSPFWLEAIFNAEFARHWSDLAWYLGIVGVAVLFTALHQLMHAMGYAKVPLLITAVAVGTFLLVAWMLAPTYAITGFIIALAAYHLVALSGKLLLLKYHLRAHARNV